MDEVTSDQRDRFSYLSGLVGGDLGGAGGDGGINTLPDGITTAIEALRARYGNADNAVAEATPVRHGQISPITGANVVRKANPSGDGGDDGDAQKKPTDGDAQKKPTPVQPSRRIHKRLRKRHGPDGLFNLSAAVGVEHHHPAEDSEFCNYPNEEEWPDAVRGVAPTRATIAFMERHWKDELRAALRGGRNTNIMEVHGGPDPKNANVAPELSVDDPQHGLYTRPHQFGHSADPETRKLERAAFLVLEDIHDRVRAEQSMLRAYKKLAGYFCSMVALFAVICLREFIEKSLQLLYHRHLRLRCFLGSAMRTACLHDMMCRIAPNVHIFAP